MIKRIEGSPRRFKSKLRQTVKLTLADAPRISAPKPLYLNLRHAHGSSSNPTSRRSSVTRERGQAPLQPYLNKKLRELQDRQQSPPIHLSSMEQIFQFGGSPQTKKPVIHSRNLSNQQQHGHKDARVIRHVLKRLSVGQSQKAIRETASRGPSPVPDSTPATTRNRGSASTPRGGRLVFKERSSVGESRVPSSEKLPIMTSAALEMVEERQALAQWISDYFAQHSECPDTTLEFYKVGKLIGKGAFGKVISAVQKLTGLPVAMKAIEKEYMADERHRNKVFQEVFILNKIRHRRVIKILEVFESTNHLLITMEYAGGGDLLQYVKGKQRLEEDEARAIFRQLIEGAMAIHNCGVLHRDFKLDNILLDSAHREVKICDFGVSRLMKKGQKVNEQCGTPAYIAPEIIADRSYEGFYSDIWSLGVCLYAMLCGTVPFKATNIKDLHKLILSGQYTFPDDISPPAKDLISRMIQLVPAHRISLEDVMAHEWVEGNTAECQKNANDVSVDIATLEAVKGLGFPPDQLTTYLHLNEMNHATATYYLLRLGH